MDVHDQMAGGGFLQAIEFLPAEGRPSADRMFAPAIAAMMRQQDRQIDFAPGVTVLLGRNGTGKSMLLQAIAEETGFSTGGGSRNLQVDGPRSPLHRRLRMVRSIRKPKDAFFLRTDTLHQLATAIDRNEQDDPGLLASYGGSSLHTRSHGQKRMDILMHRIGPQGFYLLDEPDNGFTPQGLLPVMKRILDLVTAGSQFIIATHSVFLAQLPTAQILELSDTGIRPVTGEGSEVGHGLSTADLTSVLSRRAISPAEHNTTTP